MEAGLRKCCSSHLAYLGIPGKWDLVLLSRGFQLTPVCRSHVVRPHQLAGPSVETSLASSVITCLPSRNVILGWTATSLFSPPRPKQPNRPLLSEQRWEDMGSGCPDTATWGCEGPEQQSVAPAVERPSEGPPPLRMAQPLEATATAASHLAVDCRPPGQGGRLASLLAGQPPSLLSQCGCLRAHLSFKIKG